MERTVTAPDAPTAMTLEEAIRRVNENGWSLTFDYLAGVCVTGDNGHSLVASTWRTWPEAVSQALGYPVVERDPTAELAKALAFARSVILGGEPWSETCEQIIDGALGLDRDFGLREATNAPPMPPVKPPRGSTAELVEALEQLYQVLRERHHGAMPKEVQAAYDNAGVVLAKWKERS